MLLDFGFIYVKFNWRLFGGVNDLEGLFGVILVLGNYVIVVEGVFVVIKCYNVFV